MGNAVFPSLPGLTWNVAKTPQFSTHTQRSVSGRELRAAFQEFPLWTISLSYEVLRNTSEYKELEALVGFFLARKGSFDSFLFEDPTDNTVVDMPFYPAGGSAAIYQISRTWAGIASEPVHNIKSISAVKINGTPTSAYTVSSTGLLTFASAPAGNAVVTWSGGFYYRVRFSEDAAEFNAFLQDLWEAKNIELVGSPGNRV